MTGDAELITRARKALASVVDGPWVLEPQIAFGEETTYSIVDIERFRGYRNNVNVGVDKELGEFIANSPTLIRELADALVSRSYRRLPPGYVWQDYYSPDDVIKIRNEYDEKIAAIRPLAEAWADPNAGDEILAILDGER